MTEEFSNLIDVGFLMAASGLVISLVAAVLKVVPCRGASINYAMSIVDMIFFVFGLLWLFYATLSRFSHTGRVCSGEFQQVDENLYPYDY